MKNLLALLPIILFVVSCQVNKSDNSVGHINCSHYEIQLSIDPEKQFIQVNGTLALLVEQDSLDTLSFKLNKQLDINSFSVNGDVSYELDTITPQERWLPNALKIVFQRDEPFQKGEIVDIVFSYEGRITQWSPWSGNVIGPEWVEMGLYFPWYPSIDHPFTYKLSIDIDPEYGIFAMGKATEQDHLRIFETDFPVDDLIVCASKDLKVRNSELLNHSFQIVNCTLADTTIDSIQTDMQHFYELYANWFGEIEVHDICLVVSKREGGGGYARKGGLFLAGINDSVYFNSRAAYNRYIGHEIAHFWWHGAKGNWEDWLNESFAEYSALMLIRELVGEEEFNRRLNRKREANTNTPPIWGLERDNPAAEAVLYGKGVVLLNELDEKIGHQRFLELCKTRINEHITTTEGFLNLIRDREGNKTANWFEGLLKIR